jgi:hypothetical protein
MRSTNLNRALVATLSALFVFAAVWLASDYRAPKPIPAEDFIRAMDTHQTALVDRYFRGMRMIALYFSLRFCGKIGRSRGDCSMPAPAAIWRITQA